MKTVKETILSGFYDVIHTDNGEIETFEIPPELIKQVKQGMSKDKQLMAMIRLRAEKRRPRPARVITDPMSIEFKRIPGTLFWKRII